MSHHSNSDTTWVESASTGQYIAVRHFEGELNAEDDADQKALADIDWAKIGFFKIGLTKLNGAQGAEIREKAVKGGDVAYHRDTK